MKNRHIKENKIIKEIDASFTAPEFYDTDDTLQVKNENGIYIYKEVGGVHALRSQAEIDADYLPIYSVQKIEEARNLATTRWIDSPKAVTAIQGNYNVFKNGNYATIGEIDVAFIMFVNFIELK